jgi:hypothetical protein
MPKTGRREGLVERAVPAAGAANPPQCKPAGDGPLRAAPWPPCRLCIPVRLAQAAAGRLYANVQYLTYNEIKGNRKDESFKQML